MIEKKTVFILGAGASCPYGYPSGARLRKRICLPLGFIEDYRSSSIDIETRNLRLNDIKKFKDAFNKSQIKSIDKFMAHNPELAPIGKYIISFEIFRAEQSSCFGEEAKLKQEDFERAKNDVRHRSGRGLSWPFFIGEDWYSHLYNQLIKGLVGKDALPDFSNGNLAFITFNYDRSLEQFLYEALRNSFTEVEEDKIVESLKQLKILHVYGQIAPLRWQDPRSCIEYKQNANELLLQRAANNIRTIHEEQENPELPVAHKLIEEAEQIFCLGFGYADENMEVLKLPGIISKNCAVYGTAFGLRSSELSRICKKLEFQTDRPGIKGPLSLRITDEDCLMLLRDYFE